MAYLYENPKAGFGGGATIRKSALSPLARSSLDQQIDVLRLATMGESHSKALWIGFERECPAEARLVADCVGIIKGENRAAERQTAKFLAKVQGSPVKEKKAKRAKPARHSCYQCGSPKAHEYAICQRCTPPGSGKLTCATCGERPFANQACRCYRTPPPPSYSGAHAYKAAAAAAIGKARAAYDRRSIRDSFPDCDPAARELTNQVLTRSDRALLEQVRMREDPIRAHVARRMGLTVNDLAGPEC